VRGDSEYGFGIYGKGPVAGYFDGKVGIGTDTPDEKLSVAGVIETTKGVKYPDGNIQTISGPLAYAFISANGGKASGSNNVSGVWNAEPQDMK